MLRACAILVTGILAIAMHAGQAADDPVHVTGGLLAGTRGVDSSIRIFKGIPFAAPPDGPRRWKSPQPVIAWTGVRKADAFSPMCTQPQRSPDGSNLHDGTPEPISEDCLYLNIWTPAAAADKRPVMVWIYGGFFRMGSAATALYDGESVARKGVVFVSLNYRVGPFGYLAHPGLASESEHDSSGYQYQRYGPIPALIETTRARATSLRKSRRLVSTDDR